MRKPWITAVLVGLLIWIGLTVPIAGTLILVRELLFKVKYLHDILVDSGLSELIHVQLDHTVPLIGWSAGIALFLLTPVFAIIGILFIPEHRPGTAGSKASLISEAAFWILLAVFLATGGRIFSSTVLLVILFFLFIRLGLGKLPFRFLAEDVLGERILERRSYKSTQAYVVAVLRERGKRLRLYGQLSLLLLFLIAVVMLPLIGETPYHEQPVSQSDVYFFSNLEMAKSSAQSLKSDLEILRLDPVQSGAFDDSARQTLSRLAEDVTQSTAQISEGLEKLRDQLATISEAQLKYAAFETIAGKLALATFAIILIRVVISFFRYCLRLAAFYDARADALEATSEEIGSFRDLVSALSPSESFLESDQSAGTPLGDVLKTIADKWVK